MGVRKPQIKECWWPPETRRSKEVSLLEPHGDSSLPDTMIFDPEQWENYVWCFKSWSLLLLVTTAIETVAVSEFTQHCPRPSLSLLLPLIMGKKIYYHVYRYQLPKWCLEHTARLIEMRSHDSGLAAREAEQTGTQLLQWNLNMNQNSPRVQSESTLKGLETLLCCPELFCRFSVVLCIPLGHFFPICLTKS